MNTFLLLNTILYSTGDSPAFPPRDGEDERAGLALRRGVVARIGVLERRRDDERGVRIGVLERGAILYVNDDSLSLVSSLFRTNNADDELILAVLMILN